MEEDTESSVGEEKKVNSDALIAIGITFMGAGAALSVTNSGLLGLTVLGIVFLVIGLANREKK